MNEENNIKSLAETLSTIFVYPQNINTKIKLSYFVEIL